MKKLSLPVIIICCAAAVVSAQLKQRVAVLPSVGDLEPQGLILLTDKVLFGTKVTLWDFAYEEEIEYEITGSEEADPTAGKISVNSPVAVALLGHAVGHQIEVKAPRGVMKYEIRKISR